MTGLFEATSILRRFIGINNSRALPHKPEITTTSYHQDIFSNFFRKTRFETHHWGTVPARQERRGQWFIRKNPSLSVGLCSRSHFQMHSSNWIRIMGNYWIVCLDSAFFFPCAICKQFKVNCPATGSSWSNPPFSCPSKTLLLPAPGNCQCHPRAKKGI